jgi:hypothetical protein
VTLFSGLTLSAQVELSIEIEADAAGVVTSYVERAIPLKKRFFGKRWLEGTWVGCYNPTGRAMESAADHQ